jgi:hypothetical protein
MPASSRYDADAWPRACERCLSSADGSARTVRSPRFTESSDHGLMAMGRDVLWQHRRSTPDELRARAVRLWRELDPKPVIRRLAEQLRVHHEALRNWIRQDEADRGERGDRPTTDMAGSTRS